MQFQNAGFKPGAVRWFAMSDEPGWYYPRMLQVVTADPVALDEFHSYLQGVGLSPADFGKTDWTRSGTARRWRPGSAQRRPVTKPLK